MVKSYVTMIVKIFLKYVNPATLEYDGKTLYHHDAYLDYIYYPNDKNGSLQLEKKVMDRCKVYNEHIPDEIKLEEIGEESLSKLIDGIIKVDLCSEYEIYSEMYKYSFPLAIPKQKHKSSQFTLRLIDTLSKQPAQIKTLLALICTQSCFSEFVFNENYRISVLIDKIFEFIDGNNFNLYWYYPLCNMYAIFKMKSSDWDWVIYNKMKLDMMLLLPKDKYLWHLVLKIPLQKLFDNDYPTMSAESYFKNNIYSLYNLYLNLINIYKNLFNSLKTDSNYINNMRNEPDVYKIYSSDKILCFPDNIDFDSIHTVEYVESNLKRIRVEIKNILKIIEEKGVDNYIQKLHYNMFIKLSNMT